MAEYKNKKIIVESIIPGPFDPERKSKRGLKNLEKRIAPLVYALRKTGYISTFSSCQGHYLSTDKENHKAIVYFRLKKGSEYKFKGLMDSIFKKTALQYGYIVEFANRYLVMPGDSKPDQHWKIEIYPWIESLSHEVKRQFTDKAIKRITEIIEDETL